MATRIQGKSRPTRGRGIEQGTSDAFDNAYLRTSGKAVRRDPRGFPAALPGIGIPFPVLVDVTLIDSTP